MHRFIGRLAATLLLLPLLVTPAMAAGEPITVKVALLDISSLLTGAQWTHGNGGPGWGMGGYGWGGPGQGWGMMGYGWGGPGRGNPGPWTGGPDMMSGGPMSIRIDHSTVKAGEVRFDVTNWSQSVVHEMLVIAVDNPNALLPFDYATGTVPENQVKVLGDTGNIQPNASDALNLNLAPGSYVLICNVPGHYAAGMFTALTVTP